MKLHHLKIFHALATAGSFTGAARRLGISQPAVTIQVRELEEASGVRLIERRGRRLALTDTGRALLRVTERLFALVDEAEGVLAEAGGAIRGSLRIAASGTAGAYYLPPLLEAFRMRHPEVRLALETSNSRRVLDHVLRFEADVGVLAVPDGATLPAADEPGLAVHRFVREPLVLAVSPRHRWARRRAVRLADLAAEPLVMREPGSATRRVAERALEAAGVQTRARMEFGSNEAIKRLVEAGLGVALVGARVIEHEVADGRLRAIRIRGDRLALRFFLVHHRDRGHAPLLRAFLDMALAAAGRRG